MSAELGMSVIAGRAGESPLGRRPAADVSAQPLRALPQIGDAEFRRVRTWAMLEYCKWDPQIGDVAILAPFALALEAGHWRQLRRWSEALARETQSAELELLHRPELRGRLGLPRRIRRCFEAAGGATAHTPAAARVMRFDFHFTGEGWRISEVNSDVPGGFTEASSFTRMMAGHYGDRGYAPAGDPAARLVDALATNCGEGGAVALLAAPGYLDDQQIVFYLAQHLARRGVRAYVSEPRRLRWHDGQAYLDPPQGPGLLSAVFRFYQGEWLAGLPRACGWSHFLNGGRTPVTNPGHALLSESKRFPLVWDSLRCPLDIWRTLLPETREPNRAPWRRDESWLLKAAFCNTGDAIAARDLLTPRQWRSVRRDLFLRPGGWVAQRRFHTLPIDTPLGRAQPCLGVYTINGSAAGIYARLARSQVVNFEAIDVAVLIDAGAGGMPITPMPTPFAEESP